MGQIEDVHQPENQRQADREQEHQHAELHAIEELNQKKLHVSRKSKRTRPRRGEAARIRTISHSPADRRRQGIHRGICAASCHRPP